MKTIKTLALALSLSFGFAAIAHAGESRGQVQVPVSAAKAVVAGPTVIHAYSEFSGAKLYVARAVTGTDRDCQAGAKAAASSLAADRVELLTVRAGQLACVATTGERQVELLWHASKNALAPVTLASR
jgi:hypothetical protein